MNAKSKVDNLKKTGLLYHKKLEYMPDKLKHGPQSPYVALLQTGGTAGGRNVKGKDEISLVRVRIESVWRRKVVEPGGNTSSANENV